MQLQDPVVLGLALATALAAHQLVAIPAQGPPPLPQRAAIVDLGERLLLGLDRSGPEQHLLAVLVIDPHSAEIRLDQARLQENLDAPVEEDFIDSVDFVATLQTDLE